jgi:hypothetical protein
VPSNTSTHSQSIGFSNPASVPKSSLSSSSFNFPAAPATDTAAPLLAQTEKQTAPSKGRGRTKLNRKCSDIWKHRACSGEPVEEKKIVFRSSRGAAWLRCYIHIVPIAAIAVLTYLNFAGFFIGSQFEGDVNNTAQTTDVLCLQVAAKLLVGAIRSFFIPNYYNKRLMSFRRSPSSHPSVQ